MAESWTEPEVAVLGLLSPLWCCIFIPGCSELCVDELEPHRLNDPLRYPGTVDVRMCITAKALPMVWGKKFKKK